MFLAGSSVPITLIVPAYRQAVNAGAGAYLDLQGDSGSADQLYAAGSWGYGNKVSRGISTKADILGTNDDPLYGTARQDPMDYRFDGVPTGTYAIEILSAEWQAKRSGQRAFDVIAENTTLLPAHDIYYEVGGYHAASRNQNDPFDEKPLSSHRAY